MSALYQSKVATQEPTHNLLKPAQNLSSESGKRVKLTKMAEDSKQRREDLPLPPSTRLGLEDISGAQFQQSMPAQVSKEKLYQQRQKCELKRLMKHTHPELKMLDEAVDEELAEVLSSEAGVTAGETGYEGEVLSRRLIFENCALSTKVSPYSPKMHMAEGTADVGVVRKTSAASEQHEERPCNESVKEIVEDEEMIDFSPDPSRELEEEMIRIDVQATRRIFESQPDPDNKFQGKVSISGEETGPAQKRKHELEICSKESVCNENKSSARIKSPDLTDQPHKQERCDDVVAQSSDLNFSFGESDFDDEPTGVLGPEGFEDNIKTSAALFKNNPFISTNIERENVHTSKTQIPVNPSGAAEDSLITNVKNRTHLFESMPFDKIRHQNKDEIETLVENIEETLDTLYHANIIHSDGSIIEVNETMIAKKARFRLSEEGPEIKYDEVAEGGAQNFIVQLLPRANLKHQIIYLKEDSKGSMNATVVNIPAHQHHTINSQDTEFKTANVVQLVEDILNQDNSLRKGVIIQEDANKCAEVIVYSLYNYVDKEDVKSYSAPQAKATGYYEPETEKINLSKTEKTLLQDTSQDHTCTGSVRPEVTVRGNVKLFKSCIEKGDLEYLKTLKTESDVEEQELPSNQAVADWSESWVPVDVKRLKGMFSVDQAKQNTQSTTIPRTFTGQNVSTGMSPPPPKELGDDQVEEWVPVDVKRMKNLFSGDQKQNQAKQITHESCARSNNITQSFMGKTGPTGASQPSRDSQEQTLPLNQTTTELIDNQEEEWVPVDVKRLKDMFSRDQGQSQASQNTHENRIQSTTIPHAGMSQTRPTGTSQPPRGSQEQELPPNQTVVENRGDQTEDSLSEWVSVDVKRLKDMFSSDQNQNEAHCAPSHVFVGQTASPVSNYPTRGFQNQELPQNQTWDGQSREPHYELRDDQAEEGSSEWEPVDVKKLKDMFSRDQEQSQANQNTHGNRIQPTTIPHADMGQTGPAGMSQRPGSSQEQELPPNQTVVENRGDQTEESSSEWVSVDVKRLKDIFSSDQKQNQAHCAPTHVSVGKTVPPGTSHLSRDSQDQELPSNQTSDGQTRQPHYKLRDDQAEEGSSEWVPVDVKRMKDMFSRDQGQSPVNQNIHENRIQPTTIPHAFNRQIGPTGTSQPMRGSQEQELPSNQTVVLHRDDQTEESSSEWVSVDVKRLKDMFSGDQNQNQAHCAPSHVFVGQTVPPVSNHPTRGSQDQQLPSNQTWDGQSREPHYEVSDDQAEEGSSEWEPVDVKRMKDLFSVDQRQNQAKQSTQENRAQSTTISHAIMGQPGPAGMSQSPRSCQDLTQDLLLNQTVAELRGDQGEEWAPVDVKRLKGMFSGDQNQAKQSTQENRAQSTTIAHTFKTHTLPPCTSQLPKSAQEQESPPNQTMTELRSDQEEEWVHVDVKRLKDMFSGDQGQNQTKQCIQDNVHHTTFPHASTGQTGPTVMSQSPREFQGQELPPNETLVELSGDQAEEWVPVDVKRLKDLFSGDQGQNQAKLITHENRPQSQECVDQTVPPGTSHLFSGSQERDFLSNQTVVGQGTKIHNELRGDEAEEISSEWVPVNVERLKGLFSGDQGQNQVKQGTFENHAQSSTVSHAFTGQPPKEHSLEHRKSKNTLGECSRQAQEQVCNLTVASQGSYLHLGRLDDDRIHQAELVEVVDDSDEISNLQTAIQCLQQATTEAKALYHSSQNKQKCLIGDVRDSELNQESENQKLDSLELLACQHQNTETHHEVQTAETCNKKGQIGTGVVQKHFEALSDSPDTTPGQQEQEEVVFHGKLQAALDSLERSNINVARGDFKAAMIYRNASKPHKETSQNVEVASVQYNAVEEFCSTAESKSTQAPLKQEVAKMPVDSKPAIPPKPERMNVKQARDRSNNTENPEENQTNMIGPEMKNQSKEETVVHKVHSGAESVGDKGETIQMSQKIQVRQQVQGSINNISTQPEEINTTEVKPPQENISMKENSNETDEHHVDFREACQKFGGKKTFSAKNPPVKPKRVKIAQSENKNPKDTSGDNNPLKPQQAITGPSYSDQNTSGQAADNKDKQERDMKQESKVEMREKKSRTETENERRQRLSVHMDEIMRGNITAAMEIFDNLRKQEELESILSRVEEIEQDTSEVDVRSLRRVFEDVPEWVVSSDKKKQKIIKAEHREEKSVLKDDPESKSSMAHVFGDLERASEEIINLKEQTLARLMDIEEAIKKALYSVSTLKSESDIAGLSCLFKESLGTVQGSASSGNISKISIGSSKSKTLQVHEIPTTKGNAESNEGASAKLRTSPPSSPAFISIQSAARKNDTLDMGPPEAATCPTCQQKPKTEREEKFRTTKTLTCNSPAQNRKRDPRKGGQKQSTSSPLNPKRELTVLEVQTDHEGSHVIGTKTVTEKYEQTDKFGNRIYSSKTSTVVTTQPETTTTSTGPTLSSPTTNQVSTHPEVLLPINQKP